MLFEFTHSNMHTLFQDEITSESVEEILMGLASQISEREDSVLCSDVRNNLFGPGSVQQSRLPSQFAFQRCNLPQLLNTRKNLPFHHNLHVNLQI